MWVTCYADASYRKTAERRGTWGVYIRSELGKIEQSGFCPDWIDNNTVAELYAIFCAISLAKQAWKEKVTAILVCSDSQSALKWIGDWLQEGKLPKRNDARNLLKEIGPLLYKMTFRTRWVKGHQPHQNKSVSAWVQRQCDIKAMRHREIANGKH
jgi:ribonuclease HI